MQNLFWKSVLILAVLGLCGYSLFSNEIRLGKDLRGGVSLIYRVSIPEDGDRETIIRQTIEVLKDRVNPTGVLDISIEALGLDRIEVVMPLPNQEVRDLNARYKEALEALLARSQIVPGDLTIAIQFDQALDRYCGSDRSSERCQRVAALQDAHHDLSAARTALTEAAEGGADEQTIAEREDAVVRAEIEYERLFDEVLAMSLDRSRMIRALGLSVEAERLLDANNRPIRDPITGEVQRRPSPRAVALDAIKAEFPNVADQIDEVVGSYDAYQAKRTGLDDPEDLIRLMRGSGVLEFRIAVDPTNPVSLDVADMKRQLAEAGPDNVDTTAGAWFPINDLKQWYDGPDQLASLEAAPGAYFEARGLVADVYDGQHYMLLYNLPKKRMTHEDGEWTIQRTYPSPDQLGRPAVSFQLDSSGGTMMAKLTGAHVREPMAIVLDGEVYSAPTLQSQISASGIITGNFSQSEISYLIRVLAAGALEARLSADPIAVNTLGPSIGADNLNRGKQAFIISIIAVAVFMLLYYFLAGFVADIALLANGLIIFGTMAMIDGTFTLPGLAGIVLTIGMAVDANVLIYERIREEMFAGEEDLRAAVRVGYAKALSTIIDANVTNLIVCFVLFQTATAEVKGFALTLTIGICATLFTALFVTRVLYAWYTDICKARRLDMLPTVVPAIHRMLEPSVNWIGMRKGFWTVSVLAVAGAVALVAMRGEDMFDTEFRGGVAATMVLAAEDADGDGRPDVDARGQVVRRQLPQQEVEQRIRGISDRAEPGDLIARVREAQQALEAALGRGDDEATVAARREAVAAAERQLVLRELSNAVVLTAGESDFDAEGRAVASEFQIKVANPKGLGEESAITQVVIDAIVDEFSGVVEVSAARHFEGAGNPNAAGHVFPVENENLGRIVNEPQLAVRVPEFLGGVAIVIRDLVPPATVEEIASRIEQMRNQPDFAETTGRRTQVVGVEPVDPSDATGPYHSVVVVVSEPNLSIMRVDPDVWFERLAQPEWRLVSAALQRQSSLQQVSNYSAAVAETLAANAIVAVALSLLLIVIYIWVRFGSLRYSVAAIAALIHDVTIALGLLAVSGVLAGTAFGKMLLVDDFRIDLGVVAALLTIIGYSLNDTIVILDRIRENRGKLPLPTASIVNRSINQTVSRTLLTSTTTLMAVLIMYAEGGSGIRPFTYCLLIGLLVGTYSSVAIAAPLVYRRGGKDDPDALPAATETTAAPAELATS